MLFGLFVGRSSNRLSRRNFTFLHHYQCACFRQQYSSPSYSSSYSSYSSDRGRGPSLSNPSVASVLALRPDPNGAGPQRTQVTVAGFVRTIRNQKQRSFVELGDGSTLYALQAVVSPSHAKGYVFFFFFFFFLKKNFFFFLFFFFFFLRAKQKKKKKN